MNPSITLSGFLKVRYRRFFRLPLFPKTMMPGSFSHLTGTTSFRNYWGGSSNATTHLLDAMHYEGLRVVRRETGIRLYGVHEHGLGTGGAGERRARVEALVDVAVRIYAPLTLPSLRTLVRRLRFAAPQWQGELTAAWQRAKQRLSRARVEGVEWYWPAEEKLVRHAVEDKVRLLTPFDPVVWNRAHLQLLWGWEIASRPTRRQRNAGADTMLCRCFGGIG
jgi:uncharacterized protein YcaQ